MRLVVTALLLSAALPGNAGASCTPSERSSSLDEIVARVKAEQVEYLFVGERHSVGPIKRLAVDLTNALLEDGLDVGLYVEGFRTDCPLRDSSCWSLARAFDVPAFDTLLDESKVQVHAIDPPEGEGRAASMASTIAAGSEAVRVVLVGRSHVVHAGDPEAELWVYGGGLRFPDPGDLVEAFPREKVLTLGLETAEEGARPYSLRESGCGLDYIVATQPGRDYWGTLADSTAVDGPTSARSSQEGIGPAPRARSDSTRGVLGPDSGE
jgi:hypothetical protein